MKPDLSENFRSMALNKEAATEKPHFNKVSFKVLGKIFATLDSENNIACLKLSLEDQDVFSSIEGGYMYPVPNKWGKHGWTNVNLETIPYTMLGDALETAYQLVLKDKKARYLK